MSEAAAVSLDAELVSGLKGCMGQPTQIRSEPRSLT